MISVCRFTLHRDILFMCDSIWLPKRHTLLAFSFSFSFFSYANLFDFPTYLFSPIISQFCNDFICIFFPHSVYLWLRRRRRRRRHQPIIFRGLDATRRTLLIVRWCGIQGGCTRNKKLRQRSFKARKRRNIAGDTSLPKGRRSIHRLCSLWLLWLQINRVNCQFIWLSSRLIQSLLESFRHPQKRANKQMKSFRHFF